MGETDEFRVENSESKWETTILPPEKVQDPHTTPRPPIAILEGVRIGLTPIPNGSSAKETSLCWLVRLGNHARTQAALESPKNVRGFRSAPVFLKQAGMRNWSFSCGVFLNGPAVPGGRCWCLNCGFRFFVFFLLLFSCCS